MHTRLAVLAHEQHDSSVFAFSSSSMSTPGVAKYLVVPRAMVTRLNQHRKKNKKRNQKKKEKQEKKELEKKKKRGGGPHDAGELSCIQFFVVCLVLDRLARNGLERLIHVYRVLRAGFEVREIAAPLAPIL
mmetsp:Transcript_30681/g.57329  ORF Transcript_30681/g.57329 Transcript_30681/m.57329 type:complete len:131 (+) Transcript_30681:343-735(+)